MAGMARFTQDECYEILGLDGDNEYNDEDLKKAYRRMALRYVFVPLFYVLCVFTCGCGSGGVGVSWLKKVIGGEVRSGWLCVDGWVVLKVGCDWLLCILWHAIATKFCCRCFRPKVRTL